ncbi:MAG: PAS domain-containing protein, partial [Planctomycetota bacterium]
VRDTSQRKEAEDAFRESEERYRRLINNLSVGVAQIGRDMKVLSMNRQMTRWFPGARLVKEPACHVAFNDPPRDKPCDPCPVVQALRDGRPHEHVVQRDGPDGPRYLRVVATAVRDAEGNVTSAIELLEDVTEVKHAESRLMETLSDLERFNRLAVGREMRMVELKREVNEMAGKAGLPLPYEIREVEPIETGDAHA